MEEKDRELRAIRIDSEAVGWTRLLDILFSGVTCGWFLKMHLFFSTFALQAWAKEDLLREQNKELATFRYLSFPHFMLIYHIMYLFFPQN